MLQPRKIKYIVIHCTATSPEAKQQAILDGWRKKGWKANGYHWLVSKNGLAVRLQDDEIDSNGVLGKNHESINICYIGGLKDGKGTDTRTDEQKEAILVLLEGYRKKYPSATILGHRDLSKDKNGNGIIESFEWIKLCPCFDAKKEYACI